MEAGVKGRPAFQQQEEGQWGQEASIMKVIENVQFAHFLWSQCVEIEILKHLVANKLF